MNIRGRMRNRVNVRRCVRNGVQVIAVPLVVNVSLRVGNVVSVRFRMEMTVGLIAGTVRLIRLDIAALSNAVPVDHSPLLRISLTLNVLLLWVLALNHRTLNHRSSRAVLLLELLIHDRLVAVGRDAIEMRGGVGNAVDVRRCMWHRIDVIAMLDVVGVCRRVRHVVEVRGRVRHAPLGLGGGRQARQGCDC